MFEVDFLPVGNEGKSGDAICFRFTRSDSGAQVVVVIDAGFKADGEKLVDHIETYYGTRDVDLAILTHPDGDHIGGMGEVIRGLNVKELWVHDIGAHGGKALPAADAVDDLVSVAIEQGTTVTEPWAGEQRFTGALTLLGPDESYYEDLVAEQVGLALSEGKADLGLPVGGRASQVAKAIFDRVAGWLPVEIPFEAKDVTPRNNTSMITLLVADGETKLFTADAGVPALGRAWDEAESLGLGDPPSFVQMAHHGSRRNASSDWLDRLLGSADQPEKVRAAFVSCVPKSDKHPSGRVWNAYLRRGCENVATAGQSIRHGSADAPAREGWGPITPLGPMNEEPDE